MGNRLCQVPYLWWPSRGMATSSAELEEAVKMLHRLSILFSSCTHPAPIYANSYRCYPFYFAIFVLLCFQRYVALLQLPFYFHNLTLLPQLHFESEIGLVKNHPENVFRFTVHVLKRVNFSMVVSLRLLSLWLSLLNFCSSSFHKTLIGGRNTGAHHKKFI